MVTSLLEEPGSRHTLHLGLRRETAVFPESPGCKRATATDRGQVAFAAKRLLALSLAIVLAACAGVASGPGVVGSGTATSGVTSAPPTMLAPPPAIAPPPPPPPPPPPLSIARSAPRV